MNDLTIRQQSQSSVSLAPCLTTELGKMLGLVAPITMSADQQTVWLASAVDALRDIRPDEVAAVSLEVRRTVTRPSQIVPEIARLVAEKRARNARIAEIAEPVNALPPPKPHVMDRDRRYFTPDDWAELSQHLESQGSSVRYSPDGTKYTVDAA